MKIKQVIDATEKRKNELRKVLKEIEASVIQNKTVDPAITGQMQRLIERTEMEIENLESQLHDAQDINYVEFSQSQTLPAFEETATVFYLDLDDLLRRPNPYESRPKKVGKISHKLTFGLLNRHGIAGWPKDPNEHLSFAFVCTGILRIQFTLPHG